MANGIDPRRLVSHEGDVEEANREYAASKSADTKTADKTGAKQTAISYPGDVEDAAKAYDKSKTASGVLYAEYAKNAQAAPACTSDHRENCPSDGPVTKLTVTPIAHTGARGVEVGLTRPDRKDAEIKYLTVRGEVGTQNEVGVTLASKKSTLGQTGDITWKASGEVGHADAHIGFHNSDGSTGVNAGAGAAAGSFNVTAEDKKSGGKLTVGLEAGSSAGGSFGFRDRADGKADACLQASIGPVQIGFCTPTSLPGHRK
jgi:hypothetical protein